MKYLIVSCLFCFCLGSLYGQQATFNVFPAGGFVRINGTTLDLIQTKTIDLSPGTYDAEIWVPKFEVNRVQVVVEADKPVVVNHTMKTLSADFNAYREELSRFRTARLKRTLTDGAVVGVVGGLTYVALTGNKNKINELEALIANRQSAYANAIALARIEEAKTQYNNAIAEYESVEKTHNTLVVSTGILAVVGAGLAVKYFTNKNRAGEERPVYRAGDPFAYFSAAPKTSLHLGTSTSLLGFTLRF